MNIYGAHTQWRSRPADERFASIEELHAAVKARDDKSDERVVRFATRSEVTPASSMLRTGGAQVSGTLSLLDFERSRNVTMTHWAARQIAQKIGVPLDFLASLGSRELAGSVVEDRILRSVKDERLRVLDGGDDVIRAFHGERYTRLWDSSVTRALQKYLPEGWKNPVAYERGEYGAELKPSGLYASDRDMFAFLIDGGDAIDTGDGDVLHRGFFVWNSEVGARSFGWTSFYFNRVCGNHIIWGAAGVETVRSRHVGSIGATFDGFVQYLLNLDRVSHDKMFDAVKAAKETIALALPDERDDAGFEAAAKRFGREGLTKSETADAIHAMRRELDSPSGTAWDWLQGFTAVARTNPNIDKRVDLESRAAKALLV